MNKSEILSTQINSIIGEGSTYKGDLNIKGLLRIDGDFQGKITSIGRVLIGKHGRAECNIEAESIVIGGLLKGNIFANSRVVLLSTSVFIGNINSPQLIIEDGVLLHGYFTITTDVKVLNATSSDNKQLFSVDW